MTNFAILVDPTPSHLKHVRTRPHLPNARQIALSPTEEKVLMARLAKDAKKKFLFCRGLFCSVRVSFVVVGASKPGPILSARVTLYDTYTSKMKAGTVA